jgi:MFS family permease
VKASDLENSVRQLYALSSIVFCYAICGGVILIAGPQLGLLLEMTSRELGLLGAINPLGYVVSCLVLNRVLRRLPAKYVISIGISGATAAACLLAFAQSSTECLVALVLLGLSNGAFWPFVCAWMLESEHESLGKGTILRLYNVAFTGGAAAGMYIAGFLIRDGYLRQTILFGICGLALSLMLVLLQPISNKGIQTLARDWSKANCHVLPLALLLAAVMSNFAALATVVGLRVTYAELNRLHCFHADRMGLLAAVMLTAQLCAFCASAIFEHALGMRRTYLFMGICLVAVNLTFAFTTQLHLLLLAAVLCGIINGIGFQTSLVAATEYFYSKRTGTTFHEATVGLGQLMPIVFGSVASYSRQQGSSDLVALQSPFMLMAAIAIVFVAIQLALVSPYMHRFLLRPALQNAAFTPKFRVPIEDSQRSWPS